MGLGLAGNGIACFGARGDKNPDISDRGLSGREVPTAAVSRAVRGMGDPGGRSVGRGLVGKPGLRGRGAKAASGIECPIEALRCKTPEIDPGGAKPFCKPAGGWRGLEGSPTVGKLGFNNGSGRASSFSATGDFDFFSFLDRLLASFSASAAASRSRSSSSRVFLLPRMDPGESTSILLSSTNTSELSVGL